MSFTSSISSAFNPVSFQSLGSAGQSGFSGMLSRAANGLMGSGGPGSIADLVPTAAGGSGTSMGDAARFFLTQPGALNAVADPGGLLQQQQLQAMANGQMNIQPMDGEPGVYPHEPSSASPKELAESTRTLLSDMQAKGVSRMSIQQLQEYAGDTSRPEQAKAARTLLSNPEFLSGMVDQEGQLTRSGLKRQAFSPAEQEAGKVVSDWVAERTSGKVLLGPDGVEGIDIKTMIEKEKGNVPDHVKEALDVLKGGGALETLDGFETDGQKDGIANIGNLRVALGLS